MKYPELTQLCKNCTGCQRLEDMQFKGVDKCKYNKQEIKKNEIQICYR